MSIWPTLLYISCLLLTTGCSPDDSEQSNRDWHTYKSRFISSEGRVIDTGNGDISHSEGQGYGMLLAVAHQDRETFEKIWRWTQTNLQVRNDKLFIWRKRPKVELKDEDQNDASDGDMLIAWALLQAADEWQQNNYRNESLAILDDIKRKLIVQWQGLSVVLPGEQGFVKDDGTVVNLSYWIFPALQAFAAADPDPIWQQLNDSGLTLLQQARFGHWQLPPDWLRLGTNNGMEPANNKRFGYDAVRIPLYLVLGNAEPQSMAKIAEYWLFYGSYTPAWVDLNENFIDGYGASPGMVAVKQLALERSGHQPNSKLLALGTDQDYYSSTLLLLSRLAH